MKFRATLNPTITEWESNEALITEQLMAACAKLIVDNKLDIKLYKLVLGRTYLNDYYPQNRITLILEASPILIAGVDEVYTIKPITA